MTTEAATQYSTGDATSPWDYQKYEWNGRTMVRREHTNEDIQQRVGAHRGESIWKPVHIPVERLPANGAF